MLFSQPKFRTIFRTNVSFVSTEPKDEIMPPPDLPLPETKKEMKEQSKYEWLPGERLSIALSKQAKKEKRLTKPCESKDKILSSQHIERVTASMGRITRLMKT